MVLYIRPFVCKNKSIAISCFNKNKWHLFILSPITQAKLIDNNTKAKSLEMVFYIYMQVNHEYKKKYQYPSPVKIFPCKVFCPFKTCVCILKRSDKYVFSLGMSHICLYGTLDEQLDLINGSASAPQFNRSICESNHHIRPFYADQYRL